MMTRRSWSQFKDRLSGNPPSAVIRPDRTGSSFIWIRQRIWRLGGLLAAEFAANPWAKAATGVSARNAADADIHPKDGDV
jgi:hypothetical protein